MTDSPQNMIQLKYDRQVAAWLLVCAAVIFGMILLGGVTRLTDSGLSMVEWRPLMGVIPPLSEQAWLEVFDKYKQYPEYQKINKGMDLEGFRYIFMYEYLHRVLGRLIGVLFFFPMVYFILRKKVRPGFTPKLVMLFFLGGLQGLLGWYMVKSGLVDVPYVSQYRLTAHLGLAVLIYAYMLWLVFDLLFTRPGAGVGQGGGTLGSWSRVLAVLVYLMILSGGLVAGTRAVLAYPTWPLMGDSFFPPGLYTLQPFWLSALEDVTTIQFNHRMFAYTLFVLLNGFAFAVIKARLPGRASLGAVLVMVALLAQVGLGISTLLLGVPVGLAAAHQGGAVILLTAMLFLSHVVVRQR
jgi:heme a synthase